MIQVIIRDSSGDDYVFDPGYFKTFSNIPRIGERVALWNSDSDDLIAFEIVKSVEWVFDIGDKKPSYSVFIVLSDEGASHA